ncbi:MAG: alpha/beta hydrolase [Proteobacteria bacterium]|nr:alpha/beta hydrolase [Pseudomonadota bacterium]
MRLALVCVLAYAAIAVFMALSIDSLVFFPSRDVEATPAHVGLRYDEVQLRSRDGERLGAWYVHSRRPSELAGRPPPMGVVVFCHGNAGNISHRLETLALLADLGLDVLIFDYRGYGTSTGVPSEAGLYADAEAAYHHVLQVPGLDPGRVILMGRSLGGAVAIWVASEHPVAGLVVESTFTHLADVGRHHYPWLPVKLLVGSRFASVDRIAGVKVPKLMAHSPIDEIIPYALGRRLYEAAPEPKRFLELSGGHNDGVFVTGSTYVQALGTFFDEVLGARAGR